MRYLNLGCGSRYHPDWINIDISSQGREVIAHDITRGIPLPDSSCDVVYHSHVLEHLRHSDAPRLMNESYRVLKSGGILRVATPDLEQICRLYLQKLEASLAGDNAGAHDYEWIILEMYDQAVREKSGGGMMDYLRQHPLPNEVFIFNRIGEEGRSIIRAIRGEPNARPPSSGLSQLASHMRLRRLLKRLHILFDKPRNLVLACLLSRDGFRALKIGRFRLAGEVHHWMYDRYSLAQLMRAAGFRDPVLQSAVTSQVAKWSSFNLDTLPDGTVIKPDSLFMEAVKPSVGGDD